MVTPPGMNAAYTLSSIQFVKALSKTGRLWSEFGVTSMSRNFALTPLTSLFSCRMPQTALLRLVKGS